MIAKINPEADLNHNFKLKFIFFSSQKYITITIRIFVDTFLIWKTH